MKKFKKTGSRSPVFFEAYFISKALRENAC